jgi:hypothetical protein
MRSRASDLIASVSDAAGNTAFWSVATGRWRGSAIRIVVAVLLLAYSLPNVIALRNLLTLTAFILVLPELVGLFRNMSKSARRSVIFLGILICWTLVIVAFTSPDPKASFVEWRGEWLPSAMAFFAGLAVFSTVSMDLRARSGPHFWLIVLLPMSALMATHLVLVIAEFVRVGSISPHFKSFSDHKANVTYAACTVLPFVFAFLIARVSGIKSYSKGFYFYVWVTGIVAIAAVVTSGTRNGLIVTLIGVSAAGVVILVIAGLRRLSKPIQLVAVVAMTVIVAAAAWTGVKWDPRWQRFYQTVPVALDIETYENWLDPPGSPLPITADGKPAEESAYQRIAWAKVGARMLFEHPWGLEISRSTFHDLVVKRYGRGSMAHAHNSIIDFGLNVGFPGLLLWFGFLGTLVAAGWLAARSKAAVAGWALLFLAMMFFVRSLIDSIMRDHILEQFMLTSGLLVGAIGYNQMEGAGEQQ